MPEPESEVLEVARRAVDDDSTHTVVECGHELPPELVSFDKGLQPRLQRLGERGGCTFESKLFWVLNPAFDNADPTKPRRLPLHQVCRSVRGQGTWTAWGKVCKERAKVESMLGLAVRLKDLEQEILDS
eukprot:9454895-Alexandrium_andersonii.AAC.1